MNYEKAKALIAEHAPGLILDPDAGHSHINVRKSADGPHFSITLSNAPDCPAIQPRAAVEAKDAVFDGAVLVSPAVEAAPAVEGKSSAQQKVEQERAILVDALDYAMMALPDPKADVPPGPEKAE